jgi:hypothetical protein
MKASKKRTTTQKMGKSNGRSKKTSSTRKLTKSQMKGMTGGFDFSRLGAFGLNLGGFLLEELIKHGPEIANDAIKFRNRDKK